MYKLLVSLGSQDEDDSQNADNTTRRANTYNCNLPSVQHFSKHLKTVSVICAVATIETFHLHLLSATQKQQYWSKPDNSALKWGFFENKNVEKALKLYKQGKDDMEV